MVFCGTVADPAAPLFRAVHADDGSLELFGSDGLAASEFTRRIGSAAAKTYLTAPARAPDTYPRSGERFLAAFRRRFGEAPTPYAIYGYEAMRAVLDSIRRAAGGDHVGRGAVADALFSIRERHSPLGIYSINADGDTTLAYYAGYRVRDGKLRYDQ